MLLCTLPFARHPPASDTQSIVAKQFALNWGYTQTKPSDEILRLLDKALARGIRRMATESRFQDVFLSCRAQSRLQKSKTVQTDQSAGKDKADPNFEVGDRVRLNPNQALMCHARWTWGSYDTDTMSISQQGLKLTQLKHSGSYSWALGSKAFLKGTHVWDIEILKNQSMWLGIACSGGSTKSHPSHYGADVIGFENDGDICRSGTNNSASAVSIQRTSSDGQYSPGQVVRFEVNVEQQLLRMSVDGRLIRVVRGITTKDSRPFVCTNGAGQELRLGLRMTSDPGLMTADELPRLRSGLCVAEEGGEGVILDTKAVEVDRAPRSVLKVASTKDGTVGVYFKENLMLADCWLPSGSSGSDPKKHPKIPSDWGASLVAKVEVSSDEHKNGPTVILDGNPETFWQSHGVQGQHFIESFLSHATAIKDFGIILDEAEGNYCPRRVRVIARGTTVTEFIDVITPDGLLGPKYISLLRDHGDEVSSIKVVIEDSGGGVWGGGG